LRALEPEDLELLYEWENNDYTGLSAICSSILKIYAEAIPGEFSQEYLETAASSDD